VSSKASRRSLGLKVGYVSLRAPHKWGLHRLKVGSFAQAARIEGGLCEFARTTPTPTLTPTPTTTTTFISTTVTTTPTPIRSIVGRSQQQQQQQQQPQQQQQQHQQQVQDTVCYWLLILPDVSSSVSFLSMHHTIAN
jgi:hypothetical protein